MQNRTDSGTPRFSTSQKNMDISSSRQSGQMHKIGNESFFIFLVCSQYFKFQLYKLTSEIEVINSVQRFAIKVFRFWVCF